MTEPKTSEHGTSEAVADLRLVRAALGGDRGCVERLAERMSRVPAFLRAINARRGAPLSSHDLDDLGQDAILVIWKKLESFSGHGTLDRWLYKFCLLEFMNRLRRILRQPRILEVDEAEARAPLRTADGPDLRRVTVSLLTLPDHEHDVIELRHFEGLSFERIGQRLGVPKNTVKTRYYRGLQRLRRKLGTTLPREWA